MPGDTEPLEGLTEAEPRRSRRPLVMAALAALVLLAVGGGLFAFLRSGDDSSEEDVVTEVTFDEAGNATSIPERPLTGPIMQLSAESGLAGSEVTLQGANFRADKDVRKVDLYWNRIDGPKLGTVDGPRFSVKVKIPADAPVRNEGHFILAVQRDDGKVVIQQSALFYVLPPR